MSDQKKSVEKPRSPYRVSLCVPVGGLEKKDILILRKYVVALFRDRKAIPYIWFENSFLFFTLEADLLKWVEGVDVENLTPENLENRYTRYDGKEREDIEACMFDLRLSACISDLSDPILSDALRASVIRIDSGRDWDKAGPFGSWR